MIFELIFLFKFERKIAIEFLSIGDRLGTAGKVEGFLFMRVLSQKRLKFSGQF
jgi:hypothetical protein